MDRLSAPLLALLLGELARPRVGGARILVAAQPGERHAETEVGHRVVLPDDRGGGIAARGEPVVARVEGLIAGVDHDLCPRLGVGSNRARVIRASRAAGRDAEGEGGRDPARGLGPSAGSSRTRPGPGAPHQSAFAALSFAALLFAAFFSA